MRFLSVLTFIVLFGFGPGSWAQGTLFELCPRLEGQKFIDCLTVPVCTGTCAQYSENYLVCNSFRVCGSTCQGTRPDTACPDPSTYTACEAPPRTACGALCPQGTKPGGTPTCSGRCYTRNFGSKNYFQRIAPTQDRTVCLETGTREINCRVTENGRNCEYENYCVREGIIPGEPGGCRQASISCIESTTSVPNTPNGSGCSCLCGPDGESAPSASETCESMQPPANECSP